MRSRNIRNASKTVVGVTDLVSTMRKLWLSDLTLPRNLWRSGKMQWTYF
jgi:hypothetical protein